MENVDSKQEVESVSYVWDYGTQTNVMELYEAETFDDVVEQVAIKYHHPNSKKEHDTYVIVKCYDTIVEDINKLYKKMLPDYTKKEDKPIITSRLNDKTYSKMIMIDYFPYGSINIFEE